MDLLQQVMANLEIEEGKAEKAIGAILNALRFSSGKATFEQIKQAVPNAESMMGRALMSVGARTAELSSIPTGPAAGIKQEDVPRLGRIVLEYLRPSVGAATVDAFLEKAPALKG